MSGKDHFEKDPFDPDAYEAFKRAVASRGSRPSIPNDAGIEAPEEIAERGRAMFRRALMQADADDLQEDLRQMLEALGMSDHARPYSPHRVFQEALNEMKRQLAAVPRSAAIAAEPVLWESRTRIDGEWTEWKNVGQVIDDFKAGPWRPYIENGTVEIRALGVIAAPTTSPEPAIGDPPEWLWWGEVDGKDVVTFGRWPKNGSKWRYKLADIQPTEHDHASPEPDAAREKIARIIDGRAFDNWQGQYDYAIKDNPAEFAQRCADAYYKEAKDMALEKAEAILAALSRPAHGGWRDMSTAPKDAQPLPHDYRGPEILLNLGTHADVGSWFHSSMSDRKGWWACHTLAVKPIGWMPIPDLSIPRNDGQTGGPRS